jgi:hypothetical protein
LYNKNTGPITFVCILNEINHYYYQRGNWQIEKIKLLKKWLNFNCRCPTVSGLPRMPQSGSLCGVPAAGEEKARRQKVAEAQKKAKKCGDWAREQSNATALVPGAKRMGSPTPAPMRRGS